MSKKFMSTQINYRVFEMETIAILKALLKWEDKLLGQRINVVTDVRMATCLHVFAKYRDQKYKKRKKIKYKPRGKRGGK